MKNLNLNELLETLNSEGKKRALEVFEIQKKDWTKFMKDNGIEYNNKLKQYIMSMSKDVEQETNDTENVIESTQDENIVQNDSEYVEVTVIGDEPNKPIDICDFINKKETNKLKDKENQDENSEKRIEDLPIHIESNEINSAASENNDNTENIEPVKDEIKSKRGRKKIELKEGYELYTQQMSNKLVKALNYKALTEGVDVETLVTDLLLQSVDDKYFIGISI